MSVSVVAEVGYRRLADVNWTIRVKGMKREREIHAVDDVFITAARLALNDNVADIDPFSDLLGIEGRVLAGLPGNDETRFGLDPTSFA